MSNRGAYYNELDPYAAQWLRNLIVAGHIAPGEVDERSIVDVSAADVRGYSQCHWFAGIGGWSLALRLAGWPDDRPVWSGSCPCQPFSAAGKGGGGKDERHLWPHWFRLIRECQPAIVFGEQVEAAIGWGWLDAVLGDLETAGYATGAAVLGAHSVGAPHIRQRLWFVANHNGSRHLATVDTGEHRSRGEQEQPAGRVPSGLLADADRGGCGEQRTTWPGDRRQATDGHDADGCGAGIVGHASPSGLPPRQCDELPGTDGHNQGGAVEQPSRSPWHDLVWLPCSDGKARPTQPGIFPLAHGATARVGRLRAYGNCIVPQVAAEFIKACAP